MINPKEVLEMCEKATKGPWDTIAESGKWDDEGNVVITLRLKLPSKEVNVPQSRLDANFISLARTALPELARRVIELEGQVDPYWMNKAQELEAENAKLRAVAEEPNEDTVMGLEVA